ncbi:MAG: hypothetical protein HYY30_12145 [Chloroflexi bacterium]|nr:hypothetical protein [Chloroflexota bacterium]
MCASMLGMRKSLDEYRTCAGAGSIEEIAELAQHLRGSRILHLSAVPSRPQLFDALNALTPLLQAVGIITEWRTVISKPHQIEVNKALNLALDGHFVQWTPKMHATWLNYRSVAISPDYDFVVVHDVGLLGMVEAASWISSMGRTRWVWHCHSDLSRAQPDIRDLLAFYARQYHRRIVCGQEQRTELSEDFHITVPPAIDPLSPRNSELSPTFVEMVLRQHGLNPRRPVVLYVLRDRRDLSVTSHIVDGFLLAKQQVPELQFLALVKGEGNDFLTHTHYHHLSGKLNGCRDVRLVSVANGVGNMEINAFQRAAAVVLESNDVGEIATDVLEAMWKARPIVIGAAAASRLGGEDGKNVCVAHSAQEFGHKIVGLIESPSMAKAIGQGAREYVREKFLITRLLHAYLTLLGDLADQEVTTTVRAPSMN